jgi:hypothetical protein
MIVKAHFSLMIFIIITYMKLKIIVTGTHQAFYTMVLVDVSPRLKWQECEADHSPTSGAKVKNSGAMPPLSSMSSWHGA